MRYLIAFFIPPLAVALSGVRPFAFIINLVLTLLGYVPGIIHALFVVHNQNADVRIRKLQRQVRKNNA